MLDELGNLQSEGHGIANFQTMLSIGLGQEQQFTIILQTLQQLRDVYGESVDKIVQGNAQPLDAMIATPSGWKRMGDIQVGDTVLTPFGTVTTVTGVYPKGVRPVYKIVLRDDSTTEACNEHLWAIERWKSSFITNRATGERIGTGPDGKTAKRVTEIINTEELKTRVEKGENIMLPKVAPVAYPKQELPIDPYVLGVILGDCHVQKNGVVKLACADPEIVSEVQARGYEVVDDTVHGERRDGIGYRINGVGAALRLLGLAGKRSWEKSIPAVYLYASVEQRLDLLRGLMDTDGTISERGEMEFCSVSEQLALDVQQLIRSLGGRVAVHVKSNVTYTAPNQPTKKNARTAYRVQNIRLFSLNPFLLSRKAERWHERTDNSGNRVVSVEFVRNDEVQCIRVADDRHLYLTDDYIPTHNTSNIIFLKSTDDSMLDTLQKMSGIRHVTMKDSKTVTKDLEKPIMATEGKVSYSFNAKEVPVIAYNDLAYLPIRNSIVFRAGDPPIWNRNETILLMSWRLFKDTITQPGKEYSLQTIPTLSTALEFDVRKNQPDFIKMWEKRRDQALASEDAQKLYQEAYKYTDNEIAQLDPDVWSDEVMRIINESIQDDEEVTAQAAGGYADGDDMDSELDELYSEPLFDYGEYEENVEQARATAEAEQKYKTWNEPIFAGRQISKGNLMTGTGMVSHGLDGVILDAFRECKAAMYEDQLHFRKKGVGIMSPDGQDYIVAYNNSADLENLEKAAQDESTRTFAEPGALNEQPSSSLKVTDAFIRFLASQENWFEFAGGKFEEAMRDAYNRSVTSDVDDRMN